MRSRRPTLTSSSRDGWREPVSHRVMHVCDTPRKRARSRWLIPSAARSSLRTTGKVEAGRGRRDLVFTVSDRGLVTTCRTV